MTATPHLSKIENWVGNKALFEIIKDRNRIDTIIKDIDNKEGHIHIEVLQFVNIFSLYQKLDKQRNAIVERISQTDDWEERLKIGEELTQVENEEKQFLKNVLHTAYTFTDVKLQGVLETVAESFFKGNIEQANALLNPQKLVDSQDKMLQLVKEKLKLEKAYDRLEDNANEFKVKAQLTVLNLDISDADDRFEKTIFYFERGLVSARVTERNQLIGDNLFYYAYFLQEHNRENEAVSLYEEALYIYQKLTKKKANTYLPHIAGISGNLANISTDLNEIDRAIQFYSDTLKIWQSLANDNPKTYLPNLADSLTNIGVFCFKNYKFYEAKFYLNRALVIYRKMKNEIEDFEHKLACILNSLGCLEVESDKSMKFFNEALEVRRELSNKSFINYSSFLAETLVNISSGDKDGELLKEALDIYRELVKTNPHRHHSGLAQALMKLATMQMSNNELNQAKKSCREALALYRQLAITNPNIYLFEVASSLSNLAIVQKTKGELVQAEKSYLEALDLIKQFAKIKPQSYLPELVMVQINMAMFYQKSKVDKTMSIQLIDEALKNLLPYSKMPHTLKHIVRVQNVLNDWGIDASSYLKEMEKGIDINSSNKNHINWYRKHMIVEN